MLVSSKKQNKSNTYAQQYQAVSSHEHPNALELVYDLIKPENALERAILKDKAWLEGAFWGEPRPGHPEGRIIFHIMEVLDNVEKITKDSFLRQQLRLVTIVHDTFKYLEEKTRPRQDWSLHHAAIAQKFTAHFIHNHDLLNLIGLHDEAYYAWGHSKTNESLAMRRIEQMMGYFNHDYLQLYYLFFKCDTSTGDKTQSPLDWFESTVKGITIVDI